MRLQTKIIKSNKSEIIRRTYSGDWSKDTPLWGLVSVEGHAGDEADESHCHGCGRHAEPDVHPRPCLDPDEERERDELADAEAEVGRVEVCRELL